MGAIFTLVYRSGTTYFKQIHFLLSQNQFTVSFERALEVKRLETP